MTGTPVRSPSDPAVRAAEPPPHGWAPVLAVGLVTFTLVSSEMMPVGLLPPMAQSLRVTDGTAGLTLTITGLIAAALSLFAPALVGRRDRRAVLVVLLLVLALANALCAAAADFAVLAAGRVLLGGALGVVWGLVPSLGPRLADGPRTALAMTVIFSGVSIASVIGVPLGTYLAALLDWRAAFWTLAALGVLCALVLARTLPPLPAGAPARPGGPFGALRHRGVATGTAVTALVVLGHFAGYTYVRPALEQGAGLAGGAVAACLLVYGLAGVLGNFTVGPLSGRRPRAALLLALAGIAAAALLLPRATGTLLTALPVLVLWGVSYGGVSVATQAWTRTAAPADTEATAALWACVFNACIALGSLGGGVVVDRAGTDAVLRAAAGTVLAGLLLTALSRPTPSRAAPSRATRSRTVR